MAYLGNSPVLSQQEYRNIDNISGSFNGSTTSFALLVNGVAPVPAPQSSNQCLISVNGVVQKPDDTGATGFRLSGGNIVFSAAPTSGQSFFGVILAGADYIYAGQNFPDGTVSAPPITFNQDLDTGFYRSGSGEVKFTANGANTVTFSSNGLTAPSFIPTSSSAPTNGVYLPAANTVGISTNGTGRLFINSSGQVGVGTSSPGALLHIVSGDAAQIIENSVAASNASLQLKYPSRTWSIANRGADLSGSLTFRDVTAGADRVVIDSSGRLGVGTTSPGAELHVRGSATASYIRFDGATGNGAYNHIYGDTDGVIAIAADQGNVAANSHIKFQIDSNERLRIDSSGRVGIGSSSPSQQLHVASANTSTSGTIFASDSGGRGVLIQSPYIGNAVGKIGISGTDAALALGSGSSNTTAIYIDTSQRVGIGSTAPTRLLTVQSTGNADICIKGPNTSTSQLLFGDTDSDTPGVIAYNHSTNNMVFEVNAAERFRCDSSGRLLVGTSTSPSSGDGTAARIFIAGYTGAPTSGAYMSLAKGTAASSIVSGDELGNLNFTDNAGNVFAAFSGRADANAGSNDYPGRLVFSTTADGSASPTERMRISNNGVVTIKNGAVAEIGTLTDAATITPDFASNCNFTVTLGGARTIANPTNVTAGQSGSIFIVQDGTGGRTASWGSNWDWAGGTAPTLSTGANAVDRVDYICRSATSIHAVWTGNYS